MTDFLAHAEESLRTGAASSCVVLSPTEATALLSELARLRSKLRGVADWFRYHANSECGFIAELLGHAPYDSPPSAPVTDDPTLV